MIKANFKNIGPIKEATLELGDLTIIAGQNNTGKTYLAYTLYGFLDFLQEQHIGHLSSKLQSKDTIVEKLFSNVARQLTERAEAVIDYRDYQVICLSILENLHEEFSAQINHLFSSSAEEFMNSKFNFECPEKIEFPSDGIESSIGVNVDIKRNGTIRCKISLRCHRKDQQIFFTLDTSDNVDSIRITNVPVEMLLVNVFTRAIQAICPKPFILSAERFGVSLFYKELDLRKSELVKMLQEQPKQKHIDHFRIINMGSARYAKPIKDNIDFTRDLTRISKQQSDLVADKRRSVTEMMDANYKASNEDIRFISRRKGEKRFDIPLHLASSSARGLSDLYFFLKHVAETGQLLIIDEPESHLSPTNQILMARLLTYCVNQGLKVLVTTHSDYLVKEFNNLTILHGDFEEKNGFLKRHKNEYSEGDFLDPKSVRAYVCKDGSLTPCEIDDLGIDMPVFDDAIIKINKISNELGMWKKRASSNDA